MNNWFAMNDWFAVKASDFAVQLAVILMSYRHERI
jgi:hypothetical protein